MILTESLSLSDLEDNYTDEQIEDACQALRDDYISDRDLLSDFISYNTDFFLRDTMTRYGQYPTEEELKEMSDEEVSQIVDEWLWDICAQVDLPFLRNQIGDLDESLLEADDLEIDDLSIEDAPEEEEISSEEEVVQEEPKEETTDDDSNLVNDSSKKDLQFPILIEANSQDGPQEIDKEISDELIDEYQTAVIDNINENKKFILSALDIYDFEVFYKEVDINGNIHFSIISETDIPNDQLISVLKRYFNADITDTMDEISVSLSPVLDNKFIKIS